MSQLPLSCCLNEGDTNNCGGLTLRDRYFRGLCNESMRNYCSNPINNITTKACQDWCSISRDKECNRLIPDYCKNTEQGQFDANCICQKSDILNPTCFDIRCNRSSTAYKTPDQQAVALNCPNACIIDATFDNLNNVNFDRVKFEQICDANAEKQKSLRNLGLTIIYSITIVIIIIVILVFISFLFSRKKK